MEQTVIIDDDKCYVEIPVYGDYYKRQVVMTKEIFIECYNRWIKEADKDHKHERENQLAMDYDPWDE